MLHPSVARPTGLPISPSLEGPFQPSGLSPLLCRLLTSVSRSGVSRLLQSRCRDTPQTSRGKLNRLPCTAAGFTSYALDGSGLRNLQLARPALAPRIRFLFVGSQVCSTLPSDTPSRNVPLRFATPSPPSGWGRDFHPQAIQHARHTEEPRPYRRGLLPIQAALDSSPARPGAAHIIKWQHRVSSAVIIAPGEQQTTPCSHPHPARWGTPAGLDQQFGRCSGRLTTRERCGRDPGFSSRTAQYSTTSAPVAEFYVVFGTFVGI